MKKTLQLILFSFGFFSSPAQTNIYHPFPDSNAHWNLFSEQYYGCSIWLSYKEWLSIEISGDTVIANTNYHKLEIPFIQKNCLTGGPGHYTGYQGAFREDTSVKKVFFVNTDDSTEQLLYDFNLVVGDTVKGYLMNQGCGTPDITVTSMDSVLIGNSYRKRWQLSYFFIELIEGIGSTRGLLDPVCEIIDGPVIELTCFSNNDSVLYPLSASSCELITDIYNESAVAKNQIYFSPNPFHLETKLECRNRQLGNSILKIFNAMGLLIRMEKISNITSYILHRDGLSDGLYFYELRSLNSEQMSSGKFIVE